MTMPFRLLTQKNRTIGMLSVALLAAVLLLVIGSAQQVLAQNPPLNIFKNYFVTGDYVVGGWVEQSSANGFATGKISIPDCTQAQAIGQPCATPPAPVLPAGADIVAAYLYWGTVEGSQTLFAGQQAVFNGYKVVGTVLGNPNAPTSWSSGGCTGSSTGSKTMRFYRADVRPYMPLDLNPSSSTFGAIIPNPTITVQLADSGSNGNTQPNALGATLVVVYRVLSPPTPALNAVVLYDGSYAPSNGNPLMTQDLVGFYQPDSNHTAKLTHIVANGQANKGQTVKFGVNSLLSLYGANVPPFPGVYGAWDNATWNVTSFVNGGVSVFDSQETTSVSPTSTNSGCVNWGAMIFSTTVQDFDQDGLLDTWEQNQGYFDVVNNQSIALPGANANTPDLFVELDYLTLRDNLGNIVHSHLPKQAALDAVGDAFAAQPHGIKVHFDLPAGIYGGDPNGYIISTGAGGNEILESSMVCADPATCAFPTQPAVSWKGGLEAVQNDPLLGNFQAGRAQSYHYVLFGHSLGEARSYWGTLGNILANSDSAELQSSLPQLVSIVVCNKTAGCAPGTTVTIKSPSMIASGGQLVPPASSPLILKPGDCVKKNPNSTLPPACINDANNGQVTTQITVTGSFTAPFVPGSGQQPAPPLNGTYAFSGESSGNPDNYGVITTTFKINTPNVADGTYKFNCTTTTVPACVAEPQLGVGYLGPTTSSGHADFGGGGDTAVTLGLWGADDPAGCQPDPSQPPTAQGYCNDQVGTLNVQTGTLMHELGHTLTLTHGGTYYQPNSSVPTYEMNCKPNFVSVMNYLFQVRGFVDDTPFKFDYSGQTLSPLNETTTPIGNIPALSELQGVGTDSSGQTSAHLTRWYSMPNPADLKLQDQAIAHCDGSPLASGENAGVRVDGTLAPGGTFSGPLDWNNDLFVPTASIPSEDLNHNGIIGDAPFSGFDDWATIDLQQINARSTGFGFSEGGGLQRSPGGGLQRSPGGGVDPDGSGLQRSPGGGLQRSPGGGLQRSPGGGLGLEQDTETANSSVNPPEGLICTQSLTTAGGTVIPGCTVSSGSFLTKGKSIPLTWSAPGFGQIREYDVWRAAGSFTAEQIPANIGKFINVGVLTTGTPPSPSFIDTSVKPGTYTYFVTDANRFAARSGASAPLVVTAK
jgi:hypothetical protein